MSEHYIGRAAEAAARAKHNRIHQPMKKTTKRTAKKTAKKTTKASKAFEEALGIMRATPPIPPEHEAVNEAEEEAWPDYSPQGQSEMDEDAVFDEAQVPTKAVELPSANSVEETAPDAPQPPLQDQALGQEPEKPITHISNEQLAGCIENLIDAINFAHSKGMLRKLQEKDEQIIKARIKTGRNLIAQLRS